MDDYMVGMMIPLHISQKPPAAGSVRPQSKRSLQVILWQLGLPSKFLEVALPPVTLSDYAA